VGTHGTTPEAQETELGGSVKSPLASVRIKHVAGVVGYFVRVCGKKCSSCSYSLFMINYCFTIIKTRRSAVVLVLSLC
jgi:hypothetical protein